MIVTADAGVLVRSTSRSSGPARRLLQEIAENASHELALSPFILGEVGRTLAYSRLQKVLRITAEEIDAHLSYLRRIARLVEPISGLPVVLSDPQDDPVVYTAIAAGADVLCVCDRDFHVPNVIAFCRRYGIEILDDVQLLNRMRSE